MLSRDPCLYHFNDLISAPENLTLSYHIKYFSVKKGSNCPNLGKVLKEEVQRTQELWWTLDKSGLPLLHLLREERPSSSPLLEY